MYNKKKIVIIVMMIAVVFLSIGYAYFSTTLTINGKSNITTNWNVYFASISEGTITGTASNATTPSVSGTSATISVNLEIPGDKMVYELVLTNGGDFDAVIENINAVATGSSAIIYSIEGIKIGDKLASGESVTLTLSVEYDYYVTSQPEETSKTLTINIIANQDIGQEIEEGDVVIDQPLIPLTLANKVLQDNTAYADNVASTYVTSETGIDFKEISSDTNGKGLYYTSTNTEDNGTTYYFRGNVDNNYVKFGKWKEKTALYKGYNEEGNGYTFYDTLAACTSATSYNNNCSEEVVYANQGDDMYWRIVRINEDGSIRLLYQGTNTTSSGTSSSIGRPLFASGTDESTGYNFCDVGVDYCELYRGNGIRNYVDKWYNANLVDFAELFVDAGFCSDESNYENNWNRLTYGSSTFSISFKCSNPTTNLLTMANNAKGTKTQLTPVGLLSADEAIYAGAAGYEYSSTNSTYLNSGIDLLTLTTVDTGGYVSVSSDGVINFGPADLFGRFEVRTVINLKSDVLVELTGTGEPGTATNPYVVLTN